jgi:hypothetical protein
MIGMVQAAKDRSDTDRACLAPILLEWIGDPLLQALVGAVAVEVGRVFGQDAPQVRLAQHEQVVQALPPHAAEEPLADRVFFGCAVRRVHEFDARRLGHASKDRPIFAVIIDDEMLRMQAERRGLAQLLGDPGIAGMAGHPHMHHAARGDLDHEEGVERLKEQVGDGEEIGSPNVVPVVAQERGPGLPGSSWWASAAQIPLDGALDLSWLKRTSDPASAAA